MRYQALQCSMVRGDLDEFKRRLDSYGKPPKGILEFASKYHDSRFFEELYRRGMRVSKKFIEKVMIKHFNFIRKFRCILCHEPKKYSSIKILREFVIDDVAGLIDQYAFTKPLFLERPYYELYDIGASLEDINSIL